MKKIKRKEWKEIAETLFILRPKLNGDSFKTCSSVYSEEWNISYLKALEKMKELLKKEIFYEHNKSKF